MLSAILYFLIIRLALKRRKTKVQPEETITEFVIPEKALQPDFSNKEAWQENNPYTQAGYVGQCTWFAWGRFYEIYGYSPEFTGDGKKLAEQLVKAHPESFELSDTPKAGAVFSSVGKVHAGIVIRVEDGKITIQEGNLDQKTNSFAEAVKDWQEITLTIEEFTRHHGGVIYAVPKSGK